MQKTVKRVCLCVVLFAWLCVTCTGCFTGNVSDLYSLPQLPEEYTQLQTKIGELLDLGLEYTAPKSGANRQAIQMEDLDGDGEKEVVAFFRADEEHPLKICIFEPNDGTYEEVARIEGEGTEIETIDYVDMDGDGVDEIVVGWTISKEIKLLNVYTIKDYQVASILDTNYLSYVLGEMDNSDGVDIAVVRMDSTDLAGTVELFTLMNDGEVISCVAQLSQGVQTISRIKTGRLSGGTLAVFVESTYDQTSVITDIFTWQHGVLINIAQKLISGISENTIRPYAVYSTDINGDGVMEVPKPVLLPAQSETTSYYAIEWYKYAFSGTSSLVERTYHNNSDGWYLTIPESWANQFTVRREDTVSGERAIVFSYVRGENDTVDFLTIYTLSGDNKNELILPENRFVLSDEGSTIYAAAILEEGRNIALDNVNEETVRKNFHIIYSEWQTGEI